MDSVLLGIVADWCVNVSAGWFGAAFIIPAIGEESLSTNGRVALEDLTLSLAFLGISYILHII